MKALDRGQLLDGNPSALKLFCVVAFIEENMTIFWNRFINSRTWLRAHDAYID